VRLVAYLKRNVIAYPISISKPPLVPKALCIAAGENDVK
jgi:hypothetical protein